MTLVIAMAFDVIFGLAGFNTSILYKNSFIALFGYEFRKRVQKDRLSMPTMITI
jgi:hypothetical protein